MAEVRVHVEIHGRVQGVFFRGAAEEEAQALGLAGWVRNREDGTVEAVAEGEEKLVERFLLWCHHGPPGARVIHVDVTRSPATGELKGFSVRR
jgi:acylphosphatase